MATNHANVRDPNAPTGSTGDQARAQESGPEGLVSLVRGRLKTELTTRKNVVSDTLDGLASSVRRAGAPLREQSTTLADYAEKAAGRLQQFATDLRQRDVAEFGDDLKVMARKYPGAFLATGVAAGLLAARFLKSTAEEERPQNRPGTARAGEAMGRGYRARTTRAGAAAPRRAEGERHG